MSEASPACAVRSTWITAEFTVEECELIAYWLARREAGQLPRFAAVDATGLRPWLPHLQIHERADDGRYLCRLSGIACVQAIGADSSGKWLDQVVSPQVYASAKPMFDRALANGRPLRYRGRLAIADGSWRIYHRLLLPMRQRGADGDTLLSTLKYDRGKRAIAAPAVRSTSTILGSWELTEADLRDGFSEAAAA